MKSIQLVIKSRGTLKALAAALALTLIPTAFAGTTATQSVTYAVSAINEISVSGNPANMTVNAATAGSAPDTVSDSSTTWAVTTNESTKKITALISAAMPTGVTLTANMTAPTGGSSTGAVDISGATVTALNMVTGITKLNETGLGITYQLSATAAAGVVVSASKTVTFTITDA